MTYQISVDIGGTFTDLYLCDDRGGRYTVKASTTPSDFTQGLFDAIEKAAQLDAVPVSSTGDLLSETSRFVHGTTISTNAIIENDLPKTALICTAGFKDTMLWRERGKEDPFDWSVAYPAPFIPRELTFGVEERINAEGDVVEPISDDEIAATIERLRELDVESVAVSLLWAHVNPGHERRIAELLEEKAPEVDYSLSHAVNPVIREYRRMSATAIDASLIGPIQEYLDRLISKLEESGYPRRPLIITANGGVMYPDEVAGRPIWSVDSGPTMLPIVSTELAEFELDRSNVIALDMGGTSLDMSVVTDGTIKRSRDAKIKDELIGIEKVDVKSIGSGGGSIAWVDSGGLLHVGPESAGADPGPACYGRGGTDPTVTDAALALGYLNDEYFLGGDMDLEYEEALDAIDDVASHLDQDVTDAAYSIYVTAVHDMVNGVKDVTIERGLDPRNYTITGGGGALGLFAVALARELSIDELILPSDASVVSSFGGLLSDIRRDYTESHSTRSDEFDVDGVNQTLESLGRRAEDFLATVETDRPETLTYYAEAQYPNQVWQLEVEVPSTSLGDADVETLTERFHDVHRETYGYAMDEDVEFLSWRVEIAVETGMDIEDILGDARDSSAGGSVEPIEQREAYFDGDVVPADVYREQDLDAGASVTGPAFLEAPKTTVVLPPGSELTVTAFGDWRIDP